MDGAPVAGPSKPQMSKPKAPAQDDLLDVRGLATTRTTLTPRAQIDRVLAMEDSAVSRELEVERVLAAFKLNPYAILDFSPSAGAFPTLEEIKKRYRQRSLLIHPDKIKHERGVEAFDLLKKVRLAAGRARLTGHRHRPSLRMRRSARTWIRSCASARAGPELC